VFLHWSCSKFLAVMGACTPSIHVFLGSPIFRPSSGIHSIINFGILSSGILLTWPYHKFRHSRQWGHSYIIHWCRKCVVSVVRHD
jgi:hypothetical protein